MTTSTELQFLQVLNRHLWTAIDRLRSSLDAAVYKHAVLGLILLNITSDACVVQCAKQKTGFGLHGLSGAYRIVERNGAR